MEYHQKLEIWLKENRYTKASFAKLLGISRAYFSSVTTGRFRPGKFLKEKINALTNNFGEKK